MPSESFFSSANVLLHHIIVAVSRLWRIDPCGLVVVLLSMRHVSRLFARYMFTFVDMTHQYLTASLFAFDT